ncbi:hypothetical protein JIG36_15295 [Actinoplanes sp. LDG1-06]|uniref:Uncharacterized protein n=1 Tax=Paractinoplanes ovalisporus TaxID=2810368 RepID=A0ABS2AAT6_9ACTN|nr:toxin glutamine deamidase domain-containing protein [Actinoplanes ovalisporus]MBM2616923.1 hypothetical protein [Actinoplanes ovalisporus]
MSFLPSPVPHPLEFSPFDVPAWAYEALEWVVGFDWPAGNEVATWDVADRWFSLTTTLAAPNEAAMSAANRFLSGYGGEGVTAEGFQDAWHLVAGDENAPLHDLLRLSGELGKLVEGCGADIEAAKIEAWIEIGIFLIELVGMAISVALTLGAASPAAGGLIVATRMAVQQIFKRLAEQLGKKALKQTAGRAVKQLTTRQGLRHLGREALDEGFDEAREEIATNGGIQLYQQSTGRSDGFDMDSLGRSALAGFAGGASATGAHAGSHGHGGLMRGAGGEVLAEFGAAATFGQLPDATGLAKSATSGATGSAMHGMHTPIDIGQLDTSGLNVPAAPPLLPTVTVGDDLQPFPRTPSAGDLTSGAAPDSANLTQAAPPAASEGGSLSSPIPADPTSASPSPDPTATTSPSTPATAPQPSPSDSSPDISAAQSSPSPTSTSSPSQSPTPDLSPAASAPSPSSPSSLASPPLPDGSNVLASTALGFADPTTTAAAPTPSSPQPTSPATTPMTGGPLAGPFLTPTPASRQAGAPQRPTARNSTPRTDAPDYGSRAGTSRSAIPGGSPRAGSNNSPDLASRTAGPGASPRRQSGFRTEPPGSPTPQRSPLSDLDRIAEALGPRPIPRQRPRPVDASLPRTLPTPMPAHSTPPRPEIRDEQAYFGYVEHARQTHERNRRDEYAAYLDSIAEDNRAKIVDLSRRADEADRAGSTLRARQYRHQAFELSEIVTEIDAQITDVRTGTVAPTRIEVEPPDWARINTDVGNLAPGGVRTGDVSALDGFSGRPPIDRTRHYNVTGGLRPPLAVHQVDLENAVPRDHNGHVSRLPDPRDGAWFRLANDGGPAADPTRGLNCVDGVLALFDTYIHGRPRVSAPRTFDVYANGNPDRPLGGETNGINRIRQATGGDFQNLCPYVADADPAAAKPAVDQAVQNLTNHLLNTGHGSFAFLVTDLEGGGSHSWAALNHHGTVLYLDPQIGKISEHQPMYRHHGVATPINVVSLEALVVDANAVPAPLPHHGPGNWSATPPTGSDPDPRIEAIRAAERQAFESLAPAQRAILVNSTVESQAVAEQVSADLHDVVNALGSNELQVVDEEYRVKSAESLGRKYLEDSSFDYTDPTDYLAKVKDRVRFSVETPETDYGAHVAHVLDGLLRLGYGDVKAASFWADHGRHNGLNVWLTTPDGFRIEVQFPTPLSRVVGKATHTSYEILRYGGSSTWDRVDAFLEILNVNKTKGIYRHRPSDLPPIEGLQTKPSTLFSWLGSDSVVLAEYRRVLAAQGMRFEDHLRDHQLEPSDVPGMQGVGLF